MVHVPLYQRFARLIGAQGPISLSLWMAECNGHYYATRDPLGVDGDFITAPEISQMFGEMVGIWLADLWARAGRPERVAYVELGPGRGTLAADALRVMRRFGCAAQVHFVETSPALRAAQARAVPDATWHDDLAQVPDDLPLMIVANELLDALPVRQWVKTAQGWRERMVGLVDGHFAPVAGTLPLDGGVPAVFRDAPENSIIEASPAAAAIMDEIGTRLAGQGGGALVIDYGYDAPQLGSTLQALRAHAHANPFATPGEADLTTLVDFPHAALAARRAGARIMGLMGQGAFLGSMGIAQRAQALTSAAPERGADIASALHRLTHPDQMGTLFKVLALAGGEWPDGAGFAPPQ